MNAQVSPTLRYLVLWLTTDCNLRCVYCYRGDQPGRTMPLEVARTALEIAAASGLPFHVQLAGGEPTLVPELMEVIGRIIREADWPATIAVQTNGTLVDKQLINLCRRFSISFGISLDGPPEVHESIRGSAGATFRGLTLLDREKMPAHVTAVLSALNVMDLGRLILSLAAFANVQGVALDPVVLKGNALSGFEHSFSLSTHANGKKTSSPCNGPHNGLRGETSLETSQRDGQEQPLHHSMLPSERSLQDGIHAMLTTVRKINLLRSRPIRWREFDAVTRALKAEAKQERYCHACNGESLAVHPDGTVYPCGQTVGDPSMVVGTVDRIDWERLRSMFQEPQLRGDCAECPLKDRCPGDCPSRLHYNGTLRTHHSMCMIYRTIIGSLKRKQHL